MFVDILADVQAQTAWDPLNPAAPYDFYRGRLPNHGMLPLDKVRLLHREWT